METWVEHAYPGCTYCQYIVDISGLRYLHKGLTLSQRRNGLRTIIRGIILLIHLNLITKLLALRRVVPVELKLLRGTRNLVLHTGPRLSLLRVGHRCEEIACCLTSRAFPAHPLKVCLGFAGGAEVDLATFVQHNC